MDDLTAQPQGLSPALRAQGDEGLSTVIDEILTAQSTALSPALRAQEVPSPDAIVKYENGEFGPIMFHYAAETASMVDTAEANGFHLKIVEMQTMLDDDHPFCLEYLDGSHEVVAKWEPSPIDEWRLVGKCDSEDGPLAIYIKPRGLSAAEAPTSAEGVTPNPPEVS